jgi:TRAP-type C4-dicarboxylate transport system permease small subunit
MVAENSLVSRSMAFVLASIYAVAVLFCVGIAAWIARAWTRRRYWHKGPSDLHYIAVGAALLVSSGIGILIASQIVMLLGYAG